MTATCASLTGKSKLTYDVGRTPDAAIHVRITANSGNGAFSQEWAALGRIREVLASAPAGEITSFKLRPAFAGKSANNASFMLAVLQSEGLLRHSILSTAQCGPHSRVGDAVAKTLSPFRPARIWVR